MSSENSEIIPAPAVMPGAEVQSGRFARVREHLSNRKWRYLGGVAAASAVLSFTNNPYSELKEDVIEAAPYVVTGVVASEVAFTVGGAMMLGAVGEKIANPLKIKERIPEIAERANSSKLFKAGFIINTVGAVGDFAVISTGVIDEMPVESYGLLGLTLGDLALTVAIRKGILNGINQDRQIEGPEAATIT